MPTFDLFGDLTEQEQQALEDRKAKTKDALMQKINQMPTDRSKRSMTENRLIFSQRKTDFLVPQVAANVLSSEECQSILSFCKKTEIEWTTERHSAFATTDIPIRTNELAYLEPLITERLMERLGEHYDFKKQDLLFRDIFLVKYSEDAQRGLGMHSDGCLFSLTLLISKPEDFEGGGTYFSSINDIVYLNQGDCAYHDARVMHRAIDITKGERYVLVGFIDTADTIDKDLRNLQHS
ncbi:hypothetical protein BY458DRAFT_433849 [Sporodiniella umbellata]|nr:hypothetical protein BY458DRAFT_433849 [Sporodiniella umbellata]